MLHLNLFIHFLVSLFLISSCTSVFPAGVLFLLPEVHLLEFPSVEGFVWQILLTVLDVKLSLFLLWSWKMFLFECRRRSCNYFQHMGFYCLLASIAALRCQLSVQLLLTWRFLLAAFRMITFGAFLKLHNNISQSRSSMRFIAIKICESVSFICSRKFSTIISSNITAAILSYSSFSRSQIIYILYIYYTSQHALDFFTLCLLSLQPEISIFLSFRVVLEKNFFLLILQFTNILFSYVQSVEPILLVLFFFFKFQYS